jgi:putative transcriptional regulator
MAALHEAAGDLYKAGGMDKLTMRQFDRLCLTQVEEMSAREIQALREKAGVSQGIFARVLNVRPSWISQWERGEGALGAIAEAGLAIKAKGFEAVV